jgi:hypothetical protein
MKKSNAAIIIIVGQSLLFMFCIGLLGRALWQNHFLKDYATEYVKEAGFADARENFVRGHLWIYEVKLYTDNVEGSGPSRTDGTIEPTGRMEGKCEVWSFLVCEEFPGPHREIQQAFVDAYNQHMRDYIEHPEMFDQNGYRVPARKSIGTNAAAK